jgi:CubicO group peptidase (beta-lactamase class C family)
MQHSNTALVLALALAACDSSSDPPPGADAATTDGGSRDSGSAADTGSSDAAPRDGGSCDVTALEDEMRTALAAAAPDLAASPDFTVLLEAADGRRFEYSGGASTPTTRYESASTSKWVTAAVLLELVDRGVLSLDDTANEHLSFWAETEVDLRDLMSFTSGYAEDAPCTNRGRADFGMCVQEIYTANLGTAAAPGTEYEYSGSHLQIAGLMEIEATGLESWAQIFAAFKGRTGLFATSVYDLPSETNPRLAGGMTWTAEEYLGFLRALYAGDLLEDTTRAALHANQRGSATVVASPAYAGLREDWSYGLGNWLECPTATELGSYDCGEGHRNSSAGAYGSYPFIDFDHDYFGIVAQRGSLGSGDQGVRLFRVIEATAREWAAACAE